jgi:hypothetical protein
LILSDGKISSFVIAALRLDEDLAKGLIPKKTAETVDQTSFEKIIQAASKCHLENFAKFVFDKAKPEDEGQLGPFTKCALQAILQKALSNIT